jgi:hypothetical protein
MTRRRVGLAAVVLAAALAVGGARPAQASIPLYDGANAAAPEAQGWLTYGAFPAASFAVTASGRTVLDTTAAAAIHAGYSNYGASLAAFHTAAFPRLDRTAGFTVALDARLLAEAHTRPDRAGFSVIALASDLQGIELAFWTDRVWAQSAVFVHAEEALVDTTAAVRRYELRVQGAGYTLSADGLPLLSGPLRDYSAAGAPYDRPSFLFAGDDTTSAQASVELWLWTLDAAPSCAIDRVAVPDGRPASAAIPAGSGLTLAGALHDRSSYSLEAAATEAGAALSIAGFLPGDGCASGTLPLHDTALADPPASARVSLTPPGEGLYRFRVTNPSAGTVNVRLSLSETTLMSAAWTTNGAFDTYYSFENTTTGVVAVQLRLARADGSAAGLFAFSVPGGATLATNTAGLGLARGATGTARLTHDGPAGALVVEAAIASFAASPAYVQPVRFRAPRERP